MTEEDTDATERSRGILTPADRRFLRGETDYASEQSKRDARYRIRERLFNGILDLEIALRELDGRDMSMVMDRLGADDVDGIIAFAAYLEAARDAERKRTQMRDVLGRDTEREQSETPD